MEIERKWLADIDSIPYNLNELEKHEIEQRYVSTCPTVRVRNIDNSRFVLTIKTKTRDLNTSIARNEVEIELEEKDYHALRDISSGRTIEKTRYLHPLNNGLTEEIDVFKGDLEGLCYLEIEFPSVEIAKAYATPGWVRKEVTDDGRYTNASLAEENNSLSELLE